MSFELNITRSRPGYIFLPVFMLFIFCVINSGAQSTYRINSGIGLGNFALRDQGMSPLMYLGTGFSGALSLERHTDAKTAVFQLKYDRAGISNNFGNACTFRGFAFKNKKLYHKNKEKQNHIVWGWSNTNYFNYYENSDFGNYQERSNFFTTFGLAAAYTRHFTLFGKKLISELPADVQLLGFFLRPSYVSNSPEGYLNPENSGVKAWFSSIEAFHPGKAWNFGISPKVSYLLKPGNMVSINYQYEFFRISNPEPVTQSTGIWFISLTTLL
jgi:hypothetical protein